MTCSACRDGIEAPFAFTMAFQPIVNIAERTIWAHEALVRGPNGQGAGWVLSQVTPDNRYAFDQACRIKAIHTAADLFPREDRPLLSINFLPNAVYVPASCIRATLKAADETGFPVERIMLELTEGERVDDIGHIKAIIAEYRARNLTTAIDDFGAGFSGLSLLADLTPDVIKIDMGLVRDIDTDRSRHAIVAGIVGTARALGVTIVAEGVETVQEMATLRELGISPLQGFLFARPAVEALPEITWPDEDPGDATGARA